MNRKRPRTVAALPAGLWMLLSMLSFLKHDKLRDI
jgi:hypothetical protein